MSALELRHKLQELMQYSNDLDLVKAFNEFVETYKQEKSASFLTPAQQKEVERRRENYLAGEGTSYTLEDFKKTVSDKYGL